MGDAAGFIKYPRKTAKERSVKERIKDYHEIYEPSGKDEVRQQASRCMDCGVPFCHNGCPLGNIIPDFNEAVYKQDWEKAYLLLNKTNNFPEFTGRVCPAPCEAACVLGINNEPTAIEYIEKNIIEQAFQEGWVIPYARVQKRNESIAIVGSGPAGMAAADELAREGYAVTVYEKSDKAGGLLRYGIPDFKMEKSVIDRRIAVMQQSGIKFELNTCVGKDISIEQLQRQHNCVLLCGGAGVARELMIPGREAKGVYLAMDFLESANRFVAGNSEFPAIDVKGKRVLVIGGGDTGADCVGVSNRQGAKEITQIEFMPMPGTQRGVKDPWPLWPLTLKTSTSHEEGCRREWSVLTKAFVTDENNRLTGAELATITWKTDPVSGKSYYEEPVGKINVIPCDVAFIAIGFTGGDHACLSTPQLEIMQNGNISSKSYQTSVKGIFAAGDMRRGQSLVVWAIREGREAAKAIMKYISKENSA